MKNRYYVRQNFSFPLPVLPTLLLDGCWLDFRGALADELGTILCQYHSIMVLHAMYLLVMKNRLIADRSSEI
jgi:hypothetical protein